MSSDTLSDGAYGLLRDAFHTVMGEEREFDADAFVIGLLNTHPAFDADGPTGTADGMGSVVRVSEMDFSHSSDGLDDLTAVVDTFEGDVVDDTDLDELIYDTQYGDGATADSGSEQSSDDDDDGSVYSVQF